jgi:hypothetical protein
MLNSAAKMVLASWLVSISLHGTSLMTSASVTDFTGLNACSQTGTSHAECSASGIGNLGQGSGSAMASTSFGNLSVVSSMQVLPYGYDFGDLSSSSSGSFADEISLKNAADVNFVGITALFAGGGGGVTQGGGTLTVSFGGKSSSASDTTTYTAPDTGMTYPPDPFSGSEAFSVTVAYTGQKIPLQVALSSYFFVDGLEYGDGSVSYTGQIIGLQAFDTNMGPLSNAMFVSDSGFDYASTPEPSTTGILLLAFCLIAWKRRQSAPSEFQRSIGKNLQRESTVSSYRNISAI